MRSCGRRGLRRLCFSRFQLRIIMDWPCRPAARAACPAGGSVPVSASAWRLPRPSRASRSDRRADRSPSSGCWHGRARARPSGHRPWRSVCIAQLCRSICGVTRFSARLGARFAAVARWRARTFSKPDRDMARPLRWWKRAGSPSGSRSRSQASSAARVSFLSGRRSRGPCRR